MGTAAAGSRRDWPARCGCFYGWWLLGFLVLVQCAAHSGSIILNSLTIAYMLDEFVELGVSNADFSIFCALEPPRTFRSVAQFASHRADTHRDTHTHTHRERESSLPDWRAICMGRRPGPGLIGTGCAGLGTLFIYGPLIDTFGARVCMPCALCLMALSLCLMASVGAQLPVQFLPLAFFGVRSACLGMIFPWINTVIGQWCGCSGGYQPALSRVV
jgi:hypothetical protein